MDKQKNLSDAFNYLKLNGLVHTQKDVAEKMEAHQPNVSKAFSGNESYLTNSFLKRFNRAFGNIFNLDYLCTGCGELLANPEDIELDEPQEEILKQKEKEIIFLRSQIEELRENNKFLRELIKNQKQI